MLTHIIFLKRPLLFNTLFHFRLNGLLVLNLLSNLFLTTSHLYLLGKFMISFPSLFKRSSQSICLIKEMYWCYIYQVLIKLKILFLSENTRWNKLFHLTIWIGWVGGKLGADINKIKIITSKIWLTCPIWPLCIQVLQHEFVHF